MTTFYNTFISKRIKAEKFDDGIYFKIEKVRGKTDKENFDAKRTLEDGASNARSSEFFKVRAEWSRSKKIWRLF